MYSREVSLKPPFLPLHSGVRTASVITTSSAFLEVLYRMSASQYGHSRGRSRQGVGLLPLLLGWKQDPKVDIHFRQARAGSQLLDDRCNTFGGHVSGCAIIKQ